MAPALEHSNVVRLVRSTCAELLSNEKCVVRINKDKVEEFIATLDWEKYAQLAEPMRYPLNFVSFEDEINFHGKVLSKCM
jgi:hypothetical protein